jgi:FAD dependent oxidoreductase
LSAEHRQHAPFLAAFLFLGTTAASTLPAFAQTQQRTSLAPRSFEAIAVSTTEIDLYWLAPMGAGDYEVLRDGVAVASMPLSGGHYADKGLQPDSLHHYVLRPKNSPASLERSYTERTFAQFPAAASSRRSLPERSFDLVIIQASSGGTAAAIEAAKRGLKVALIEQTTRVGGMPVNGLSATDLRRTEHAEGIFVQFKDRVKQLYAREGIPADGFSYEPRLAHQAMKSLLYDQEGITLYRRTRLSKVEKHEDPKSQGSTIVDSVIIEELKPDGNPTGNKARFRGRFFVDATDCGDLAAWAGAPFRLGRESRSSREPHNGMIYYDRAADKPLPGSTGAADRRIQAYSYLLTVKDYGKGQNKTIPMPRGYNKQDFVHTPEWLKSWAVTSGTMPGSKMELNQHPQGGDIQEINYRYPLMTYAERARIDAAYREHVMAYLYYIQTEQGQKQVGLPDDEYRDSGGFPPLLYVREGRRILGDTLLDETDIHDARSIYLGSSFGLGDYPMDSHAVRRKVDWSTPDMGEGEWWLYRQTPVHQLPLGMIVPKTLQNVFVTTAVSSTHVSFGTYRLEPVRMAAGQAAAICAQICMTYGLNGHQVPARQVQDALLPHAANPYAERATRLVYYTDLNPDTADYRPIQMMASRGIGFAGDQFLPEKPVSGEETVRLISLLAKRAVPGNTQIPGGADSLTLATMGKPALQTALPSLTTQLPAGKPVTRLMLARALTAIFPWHSVTPKQKSLYIDLSGEQSAAADSLRGMGIEPEWWDGPAAAATDKKRFKPDASVTRSQLLQALYLISIQIGPAFDDHPSDIMTTIR